MEVHKVFRRSYWLGRLRKAAWNFLSPSWTFNSGVRVRVRDEADWITFCDLFLEGEYDTAIRSALDANRKSVQIVDLGSNVGWFYLHCLDWHRRLASRCEVAYLAVEPNPSCVGRFQANVRDNCDELIRVEVYQGLVGERDGYAHFYSDDFHIASRVAGREAVGNMPKVPYINISSLVQADTIDLLKVDIEGSELTFVENYGDVLARTMRMIVEIHGDLCDGDLCRKLIEKSGMVCSHSKTVTEAFRLEYYVR